jgi:phosphoenolpyruvate carboxykinase (GTP)
VPVAESLNWEHGVFIGATVESETTSATLGAVGQRKSSPMANMDFMIIPLSLYIKNHIKFGRKLKKQPKVYAMNYFLKGEDGGYLNEKTDKKVWVLWAEGRVHGDFEAIRTPIGNIPKYEDLKALFEGAFEDRTYTKDEYEAQFCLRVKMYLDKLDRMEAIFRDEEGMPDEFWQVLNEQRRELEAYREKYGDAVSPFELYEYA